jgi:hypothetical protein
MGNKIKIIEIPYGENIVCPFCHFVLVNFEELEEVSHCDHTIFIATDDGWEYQSEKYVFILGKESDGSIDQFTSELKIPDLIKYAQYNPAPSYFGAYFGFLNKNQD